MAYEGFPNRLTWLVYSDNYESFMDLMLEEFEGSGVLLDMDTVATRFETHVENVYADSLSQCSEFVWDCVCESLDSVHWDTLAKMVINELEENV